MKRRSISIVAVPSSALDDVFSRLVEFARYFAVSGVALAVDFALLMALARWTAMPYHTAAAIGFLAGMVVAYVGAVRWAFEKRSVRSWQLEFAIFAVIGLVGLIINEGVLSVCVESLALPLALAKMVSAGIVFASNFVMRKWILFA